MAGVRGWQEVREAALARIRSGDWPAGGRIPDEADLARDWGCARATVNRALRELAAEGWLERRRKGGTRVPALPVRRAVFGIAIIRQEVEARGGAYGYRLLADATAPLPGAVAAALDVAPGAPWRHVVALHLADGAPYCVEDRWLDPAAAPAAVLFEAQSANEWLVRTLAYARGSFAFAAVAADAATAAHLACAPGAALLALERATFAADGRAITQVRLLHAPGHRVEAAG